MSSTPSASMVSTASEARVRGADKFRDVSRGLRLWVPASACLGTAAHRRSGHSAAFRRGVVPQIL